MSFPRTSALALLLALLGPADLLPAQPANSVSPLAEGQKLLKEGHLKEAADAFRKVTLSQPKNGQAWMLLGYALHAQGKFEEALPCHRKAATLPGPVAGTAGYNAACALARLDRKDLAFQALSAAIRTGNVDVRSIAKDEDLASLHSDVRFKTVSPSKEDFEQPFVEKARILQVWNGEAPGGQFGWIARNIGDVDGDGVSDVTTSAPSLATTAGASAGAVYVYSSRSGKLIWRAVGQPGDQLGLGIEAAGDVNADGVPDVIAGSPGAAKAEVFSGKDGTVIQTFRGKPGALFGRRVSDVGDVDGDGHADVLIGSPQAATSAGAAAGRVGLYSGKTGEALVELEGVRAGDQFGSSCAGIVHEGQAWLVLGAPGAGTSPGGRTYVYDGKGKQRFVIEADATGSQLGGMFVSVLGDVDEDGVPDVYASDWANNANGPTSGRIYVHSGKDGRRLLTLTGETAGEGFGIGPADAGDVDGDGLADLVVGAWQHSTAAPSGGKVTVFSGKDGTVLETFTCRVPGETFGFDATGIGDVDGDGAIDYLLTSAWSSISGVQTGRMFILAGGGGR
ncbi:MAG: FG-GAP-like repeat-containing protein [Planctomycetota bacterium]